MDNEPQAQLFCPACGAPIARDAKGCASCGKRITRALITLPVEESPEPAEARRRSLAWGRISVGVIGLLVLAVGGYTFARYHHAQSDLADARKALQKDRYRRARGLADTAQRLWPWVQVRSIDAQADALANSAHYYQVGTAAFTSGQYALAASNFKMVAAGDIHYAAAQHDLTRTDTGIRDLQRVKMALRDVESVLNDMQTYSSDYNTTVGYSNTALADYQNNGTVFGYSPGANFDTNVADGQTALSILESDASRLSTDGSSLSATLGLISATPTLSQAAVSGIDSAIQDFVNNTSQIDTNMSSELASFQSISNGTASQAYGLSGDISGANQAEAGMTTDENNLQGAVSQFVGYTAGVVGSYLGLTNSLKSEFETLVSGIK